MRRFKGQYPVPTYVVEFLLGRYCASIDPKEIDEGLQIDNSASERCGPTRKSCSRPAQKSKVPSKSSTSSVAALTPKPFLTSPCFRASS